MQLNNCRALLKCQERGSGWACNKSNLATYMLLCNPMTAPSFLTKKEKLFWYDSSLIIHAIARVRIIITLSEIRFRNLTSMRNEIQITEWSHYTTHFQIGDFFTKEKQERNEICKHKPDQFYLHGAVEEHVQNTELLSALGITWSQGFQQDATGLEL